MQDIVGKVFYESWGYDQTNIDFAVVCATTPTGKTAICRMMGKRTVTFETVEPTEPYGETFRLRVKETLHGKEPMLAGTYPFVQGSGRRGYFWLWDGKPVYETPAGLGH